jgi:hypothetical protein
MASAVATGEQGYSPSVTSGGAAELERPAAWEVVGRDVGRNKKAWNYPALSMVEGGHPLCAQLQPSPSSLNDHRRPIRTKTASEQSSPNSEKIPRKLRDLIKRNAGFMAKASAMMRARASRGFWS